MSNLAIPFNIAILFVNEQTTALLKPVRTLDIFEGSTKNFHEDGLFSQSIFGRIGSDRRNRAFSYIDIKINIFHPLVYKAFVEIKRLYGDIMSSKEYATWDEQTSDFVKASPQVGETGYHFFIQHWNKIKFGEPTSDKRARNMELIEKYKKEALTSKIIVIPAGLRDFEITADGRESEDEFNDFYRQFIKISNTIQSAQLTKDNIQHFNLPRMSLQTQFNKLYDHIQSLLDGKRKLIMGKWASRGIYNGTRNVISSANIRANRLDPAANVGFNDTVVGLYQYLKATLPVSRYQIKNHFLSKVFPGPMVPANLVDKKTLKGVSVNVAPSHFDAWMTDEGLESTITSYGEEFIRHRQLEIDGYFMGLIYKGPQGHFKLFNDIDELPPHLDKKHVTPVTFTELLYAAVYSHARKYAALVTRYPILGFGSIYPSKIFLKPTVVSEERRELDEGWGLIENHPIAYNFPTVGEFINSMSPSPSKLAGLGAD